MIKTFIDLILIIKNTLFKKKNPNINQTNHKSLLFLNYGYYVRGAYRSLRLLMSLWIETSLLMFGIKSTAKGILVWLASPVE